MFILQLNDMRSSQIEILQTVARADTAEELLRFLEDNAVDAYRDNDDKWQKQYKKGGPLEWYNPPWIHEENIIDVGTVEDWEETARRDFNDRVLTIMEVKYLKG